MKETETQKETKRQRDKETKRQRGEHIDRQSQVWGKRDRNTETGRKR